MAISTANAPNLRILDVGLTILHQSENPIADIVFVHGLQGHPRKTWARKLDSPSSHRGVKHLFSRKQKDKSDVKPQVEATEIFWPLDLLPDDCNDARIMTWGYDSHVSHFMGGSTNLNNISAHAQDLLYRLENQRNSCQNRSLCFVAHSLGGIIVKDLLYHAATSDSVKLINIYTSTQAILFLGTPHLGSSMAETGEMLRRIASASGFNTNDRNVRALYPDSSELEGIHRRFLGLQKHGKWHFEVSTFQEAKGMTGLGLFGLGEKVVGGVSSSLHYKGERCQTINANHMDMCRFTRKDEDDYQKVVGDLKSFLSSVREAIAAEELERANQLSTSRVDSPSLATTVSSKYSLNEDERLCITLFSTSDITEYRSSLPIPVKGTCQWLLTTSQYLNWLSETKACLLWISGHPGSGKTVLSVYVLEHLSRVESPPGIHPTICCFFCNENNENQRDGKAILRSLIFQILKSHRKLIRHLKSAYEIQGPHLAENFSELWRIFMVLVNDRRVGPMIIIIDAIDECEENTRNRFLQGIASLIGKAQATTDSSTPVIKFLTTSRTLLARRYDANLLEIEDVLKNIKDDLRLVIQVKVEEIARRTKCSPQTRSYLEKALESKSDETFLWLTIILKILERSYLASQKDFKRILDRLPQGLVPTYERFLSNISVEHQGLAAKLLHIIVGSFRPLYLDETQVFLALQEDHRMLASVEEDYQPNIRETVEGILGPLVRISNSRVHLVHLSLKEYLYDLSSQVENPLSKIYGTNPHEADMLLTKLCILYLQLDEFKEDLFSAYQANIEDSPVSPVAPSLQVEENSSFLDPFALGEDTILRDPTLIESEACEFIAERFKLFDYCAMHWARHFSSCNAVCSQEVIESALSVSKINDYPNPSWFPYYWYYAGACLSFPRNFDSVVIACYFGHLASVVTLLGNKHLIDQDNVARGIYWAARMGHQDVVGRLLQFEVQPDSEIIHGKTALAAAAEYGHVQVVELLYSGRRDRSASNGYSEVVAQILLHKDVQPDISDSDDWTPLFWAVGGKHLDIVRTLSADERVDRNHVDKQGRNALSWAAEAGEDELVKHFLTYKDLDVDHKDRKGRTPLSWAAGNGKLATIMTLRQSRRVNVSEKDNEGRNAISWACSGGHHAALAYLIKHDPKGVDEEDGAGWTPLAWALDKDDPKTVQLLLDSGLVNVNRKDRSGRTPLEWAAVYGYADIVQVLLEVEGVEKEIKNNAGGTALSAAIANNHTAVINLLKGLNE